MSDDAPGDPKVALVTGANTGIGLAVVAQLARLGMRVLLGSRDLVRGETASGALKVAGIDPVVVQLDTTDELSVLDAADDVRRRYGRLDVLVNNAAIKLEAHPSPPSACPVGIVRRTFETNVLGTVRVTQAMLPLLLSSPAPRIVNVSSGLGSLTLATTPGTPYRDRPLLSYNVSKAALNAVTVQFANELRDTPCKVNAADPGYTATRMTADVGRPTDRTPDDGARVIVRLATLDADGPTGGFFDDRGVVPW